MTVGPVLRVEIKKPKRGRNMASKRRRYALWRHRANIDFFRGRLPTDFLPPMKFKPDVGIVGLEAKSIFTMDFYV